MYLQEEQQKTYEEKGFLLLPNLFDRTKIEAITTKLSNTSWKDVPGTVLEEHGQTLRAIHEDPTKIGVLEKLSKHPKLVEPAMQILGSQVYIHQFKINFKDAFSGDVWPWHQDFIQGSLPDSGIVSDSFDAIICVGTFTPGHAPAESLRELVRITKKGGYIVYSIRKHFYEDQESHFQIVEEELTKAKHWKMIAKIEDEYLPAQNIKGCYFCFQVLK